MGFLFQTESHASCHVDVSLEDSDSLRENKNHLCCKKNFTIDVTGVTVLTILVLVKFSLGRNQKQLESSCHAGDCPNGRHFLLPP